MSDKNEPRVLTLEEVKQLRRRDEIWLEYGGAHNKLFMLTISRKRRWGFTFFRHLPVVWDNYGGPRTIDITWWWRIWSDRPTQEQREAAKWEAAV